MRTVTALLLAASAALAVSAPASAETLAVAPEYRFASAPAGTTDAVRQQAGQRVPLSSGQVVGHLEPVGTTDAVRQQAGRRVSLTSNRIVSHLEPAGTTDAVRQQAGRDKAQASGRTAWFLAINPVK